MSATGEFDRITIEPGKMNGQPCIRGMRLTVRRVLEALSTTRRGKSSERTTPSWRMRTSDRHWRTPPRC
jgi:uncharacterized protein (DUF433 family)